MLKDFFEQNDEQLTLYTKAITKAHGAEHPEVFRIYELYKQLKDKANTNNWNFSSELNEMSLLTDHFSVPSDACEAMTTVYQKLAHLSRLNQTK